MRVTDPLPRGDVERWDARYRTSPFFYGTEPNDFLREVAGRIRPGGSVLCLGEGEGRNACYLAALGLRVTALDQSAVGLATATDHAVSRGVHLDTVVADLADYAFDPAHWDAIISIWCHLPSVVRRVVHRRVVEALAPGGVYVLESYTPAQIALGTGGPRELDLLPTLSMLRGELDGLSFDIGVERERVVHEGRGHNGPSAVAQLVARRPAP